MRLPGDDLKALCAAAQTEVLLAAPFIKTTVLETLIQDVPSVTAVTVVTRWYPEEIAAGASDLEVWDVIEGQERGRLLLHQHLHAKYYRAGERALIGSANLTNLALGWVSPANVELLVLDDPQRDELVQFETTLLAGAVRATRSVRDHMAAQVDSIEPAALSVGLIGAADQGQEYVTRRGLWVPQCGRPDRLFDVYRNYGTESLIQWTVEAGRSDLDALRVPGGLTRSEFDRCIAAGLRATEIVKALESIAEEPVSDARGQEIVRSKVKGSGEGISAEDQWELVKLWLTHFLPDTFRLRTGTGELVKGQVIGNQRRRTP